MPHRSDSRYSLSRPVVGTSRCVTSVSRLAVAADHLVADVGQTDCADQERVEVLLLVDDGVADRVVF